MNSDIDDSFDLRLAALQKAIRGPDSTIETAAGPLTDASGRVDKAAVALSIFNRLLASDGLRPALYSLLRQSDYRYIGIFRFKNGRATSAVHVDRQNLMDKQAPEVNDTETYCSIVRATGQPFMTSDAAVDDRLGQHVARHVVRAYHGVPLLDASGTMLGTLCHYDVVPRDHRQLDTALLTEVASVIGHSGRVPPYPQ